VWTLYVERRSVKCERKTVASPTRGTVARYCPRAANGRVSALGPSTIASATAHSTDPSAASTSSRRHAIVAKALGAETTTTVATANAGKTGAPIRHP
jgi:hypothetical protein